MARHRTQYTWRGRLIRIISHIVRALASIQGQLIIKDRGPLNK